MDSNPWKRTKTNPRVEWPANLEIPLQLRCTYCKVVKYDENQVREMLKKETVFSHSMIDTKDILKTIKNFKCSTYCNIMLTLQGI